MTDFHSELVASRRQVGSLQWSWRAARLFWVLRTKINADQLAFDPEYLPSWVAWNRTVLKQGVGENRTPRIREEVLGPLIGWALRFVEDFADDILNARDEYLPMRFRRVPPPVSAKEAVTALLQRYRRHGRPLPAARPQPRAGGRALRGHRVNKAFLAKQVGLTAASLEGPWFDRLVTDTIADVGLADDSYLTAPVRGQLDAAPGCPGLPTPTSPISNASCRRRAG